ncbi:hypothetical protein KP509_20G000400 [Ceratopteris richardii]|uniref:Major facilitator superfamily (MFS) profile domain-containing protein n=1 Tax=Ceratopteris richardii TaxID=49495 RepID=A0A8T2SG57_CERRI|nr:hypothetical protein KP509_20G000400 [Ceratopteris richardii]
MEHADEERGAVNSIKPVKSDWDKKLFWTLIVVNLAGIMERADEALLPAVYREVGLSLHASPTKLGTLTLLRSVVQVLCFPLASYLSITHNRANIIAIGAIMWAIATFFVGASTSYLMIAVARSLNGIGLALVIPAIDSLVADAAHAKKRGLAFGWLQFTGSLGSVFGTVFALLLAGTTVFGIAGWRASFYIIGAASALVGFLVYQFAVDPRSKKDESGKDGYDKTITPSSALKQTVKEAIYVIKIPTFRAIVLQGVAGSFPWAALTFASMWLELIGFSHNVTAAIVGIFSVSSAIGGLLGGRLGDLAARAFPNAGRVMLAQFSSGIGIPFGAIVLLVLPYKSSTISGVEHGVILFLTGLLMSWCATGTNKWTWL